MICLGNIDADRVIEGKIGNVTAVRSGVEYMVEIADWYTREAPNGGIGFFQIGGASRAISRSALCR